MVELVHFAKYIFTLFTEGCETKRTFLLQRIANPIQEKKMDARLHIIKWALSDSSLRKEKLLKLWELGKSPPLLLVPFSVVLGQKLTMAHKQLSLHFLHPCDVPVYFLIVRLHARVVDLSF